MKAKLIKERLNENEYSLKEDLLDFIAKRNLRIRFSYHPRVGGEVFFSWVNPYTKSNGSEGFGFGDRTFDQVIEDIIEEIKSQE